jgi:hypothetical protein
MKIRKPSSSALDKKAKRGFRGYPVATVAFYGPDAVRASKVAVGIVGGDREEASNLGRWVSDDTDVRSDKGILDEVLRFIQKHAVKSVVMTDGLLGCPHEEGIDYPEGACCPKCPYWSGRDRFRGSRVE